MQHTTLRIIFISTLEIVLGVDSHIACWHIDILIVRNIHACRVIHLIISACRNGERRYGTLTMIEYCIHIGWEHALISIVYLNSRIRPPKEGLRQISAIAHTTLYLEISTAWTQRKASHTLLVEHPLQLVHPYGNRTILVLNNSAIHRHKGTGTMVLRPIKLNTARYPRASQSHKCRLHHMIIIDEMTLLDLIISHLDASTQFGQNHNLDIFVLKIDGLVVFIGLLIAD